MSSRLIFSYDLFTVRLNIASVCNDLYRVCVYVNVNFYLFVFLQNKFNLSSVKTICVDLKCNTPSSSALHFRRTQFHMWFCIFSFFPKAGQICYAVLCVFSYIAAGHKRAIIQTNKEKTQRQLLAASTDPHWLNIFLFPSHRGISKKKK